jgi:hypothetical protein
MSAEHSSLTHGTPRTILLIISFEISVVTPGTATLVLESYYIFPTQFVCVCSMTQEEALISAHISNRLFFYWKQSVFSVKYKKIV